MKFKKGDIVLVPFPFTDLSGYKLRPALVLYDSKLDTIVCFISSVPRITGEFDLVVLKSNVNGLKVDSVIKLTKIATLSKDLILGKIGELEEVYLKEIEGKLKIIFNL
jgi:mRNA interferase MazF